MRRGWIAVVSLVVLIPSVALVLVPHGARAQGRTVEVVGEVEGGLDDPIRLPTPRPPRQAFVTDSSSYQLVGYTSTAWTADKGVLNLTLACQAEFPGSRMCFTEVINRTVNVPDPPGIGAAWVQPGVAQPDGKVADCHGWTSSSATDTGTAIGLGDCGCYGGIHLKSCETQAFVACCAMLDLLSGN